MTVDSSVDEKSAAALPVPVCRGAHTESAPDMIPLSALQHWAYCPRQCALIHVEQAFDDNVHTVRGHAVHATVDHPGFETRAGKRIVRALPIWSERLGLIGKADIVEIDSTGAPYPVEYKHGSRRKSPRIAACDDLQLAAQAMCLEEMTGHSVVEGAVFYASSRRRRVRSIDDSLRSQVEAAVVAIRTLLVAGQMPPPINDARCTACSLIERCQPEALAARDRQAVLHAALFEPDA